jgi:tRNA threonylcarbamoyladenosine biosynthesis protein TsaB
LRVLALDTCLGACSAVVLDGERVVACEIEAMERGHQERVAPVVAAAVAKSGLRFSQLERIGITVGPGSFTGLRVGIAFAKGLALALSIPAAGIGTLEALAASAPDSGLTAAVIDARRERVYFQAFVDGAAVTAPDLLDLDEAAARLAELSVSAPLNLVGPGANLLSGVISGARLDQRAYPDPEAVARLAAARSALLAPLRPLYLRAPDAKTIAERQAEGGCGAA